MNINAKSLLEMNGGAFMERTDYEVKKVLDNILDANTKAVEKRKITLTFTFSPDENRTGISVALSVKSTLAPTMPSGTSLYVMAAEKTGEMQVVEMTPQVPGQIGMDGQEQQAPARLKIIS